MTSLKQLEANRLNSRKSTGPSTDEGKLRSRCNAVRHGLTAETVISSLEDAEDYRGFEAAIVADYDAQSAVERELVLRLASLLWRLRRASIVETGLFDIQAAHVRAFRQGRKARRSRTIGPMSFSPDEHQSDELDEAATDSERSNHEPMLDLAKSFLRLANLPNYALDRLSRYEATIWRQAGQIMFALDALKRRKPWERQGRFRAIAARERTTWLEPNE